MLNTVMCCIHPIFGGARHTWFVDTETETRILRIGTTLLIDDMVGVGWDGLFVCPICNRDGQTVHVRHSGGVDPRYCSEAFLAEERQRIANRALTLELTERRNHYQRERVRNINPCIG